MASERFNPLFSPTSSRPEWMFSKAVRTKSIFTTAAKDYFHISTWLCIGGVLQALAWVLFGPVTTVPLALLLLYRVLDVLLMTTGITKKRHMEGAIRRKWGAQIPHSDGTFGPEPADEGLVVFFVGGQVNHPLGPLAPGCADNEKYFGQIAGALENYYDKHGLLGYTQMRSTDEHSNNMSMFVMYWRDVESLHNFAHGPEHMAGLRWWSKVAAKKYPHISVFHETYIVPKGHYENIYLNCKPLGMGAIGVPINGQLQGEEKGNAENMYVRPIVDSKKGRLRTFARRVRRNDMTAHEKDDNDVWDNTVVEAKA